MTGLHGFENGISCAALGTLSILPISLLAAEADEAELFLYPGNQHYFADSSLPSYAAEAAVLLMQRVIDFLADPIPRR